MSGGERARLRTLRENAIEELRNAIDRTGRGFHTTGRVPFIPGRPVNTYTDTRELTAALSRLTRILREEDDL